MIVNIEWVIPASVIRPLQRFNANIDASSCAASNDGNHTPYLYSCSADRGTAYGG